MSFVTAGYRDAMPTIQTGGKGFVDFCGPFVVGKSTKYRIKDFDGRRWLIYINPIPGVDYDAARFFRLDPNTLIGPAGFKGTIQVCKNPLGLETEPLYDKVCGAFVCEAKLTAVVNDTRGTYTFHYTKIGPSPLLMFALPHHIQSLDPELRARITRVRLRTTTKGMATAVLADKLSFTETNLPVSMHFSPWQPNTPRPRYTPEVLALIAAVAERDLRRAMSEAVPQESMYYAGKCLGRFATILWVMKDVLGNEGLMKVGLEKLKLEMGRWIRNEQRYPIYYDDSWKGVVSNAGFTEGPSADFGNTYYHDHHMHFAYFVYTAAVIGYLDPTWLDQGDNKSWTNMLVKDFAESDYNGRDYPFQRCFDWWHGHSWAKGLGECENGKEMEATCEDGVASFAVKMWGRVMGDLAMEKRGTFVISLALRWILEI